VVVWQVAAWCAT
jgi:hypothetical protein